MTTEVAIREVSQKKVRREALRKVVATAACELKDLGNSDPNVDDLARHLLGQGYLFPGVKRDIKKNLPAVMRELENRDEQCILVGPGHYAGGKVSNRIRPPSTIEDALRSLPFAKGGKACGIHFAFKGKGEDFVYLCGQLKFLKAGATVYDNYIKHFQKALENDVIRPQLLLETVNADLNIQPDAAGQLRKLAYSMFQIGAVNLSRSFLEHHVA